MAPLSHSHIFRPEPAFRAVSAASLLQSQGGGLGLALGTTERSAKRYIAELREAGHIDVARSEGRSWHYRLETELRRTATLARASFTIVEFVDGEWLMAARRCWIGILSYLNRKNRLAVVGIDKLAIAIGKSRRQTQRLIRELKKAGFLTVTRGKRSCSVYAPIIARSARQPCPTKHDSHDPLKHDSHDPLSVTDSNSFQGAKQACETVGCGKRDFGALIDGLLSANAKKRKMALEGMGAETKTERILPPQLKLRTFRKEMKNHEQCHDNLAGFRKQKGYCKTA